MNHTSRAVFGVFFYSVSNTVLGVYLKSVPPITVMLSWYAMFLPFACILYLMQRGAVQTFVLPQGMTLVWMCVSGVTFFIADYLYINAVTKGDVVTCTILIVLMPVFTGLMVFAIEGKVPSPYHVATFCSAVLTILLSVYAQQKTM